MGHTDLRDVQYGKIRVKYHTAYYTNEPYDPSLIYNLPTCTLLLALDQRRLLSAMTFIMNLLSSKGHF